MSYTQLALIAVAAVVINDLFLMRTRLLTRAGFWTSYAIVIFFQLLTNAWLTNNLRTGTAVVNYDENQILGLRIAYAPVEDLLFGFALVVLTLSIWVSRGRASSAKRRQPGREGNAHSSSR